MTQNIIFPGCFRVAMLSLHSCPLGNLGTKDTGGMSVYIREIATELAKLGYSIDIFTRQHWPHGECIINLSPGVRLIHLNAGETREVVDKLALYPHTDTFARAIDNFSVKESITYQLVFSHYWLSGITGKILASNWKVPHAVMFHTLAAVKNQHGIGGTEPELRLKGESAVVKSSDRIIVSTENEKRNLVDLYEAEADNISIIPCGVNTDLFKPLNSICTVNIKAARNKKLILYVGRIEPLKGLGLLLDSLALIDKDGQKKSNWHCLIIGGGESSRKEMSRLNKQAVSLGIEQSISFLGLIPHKELVNYYNAASVLAVPSYYESFGLVALEAMASGCPVVSTDVGDLRNILIPGISGDVIDKKEARELANALTEWIDRKPLSFAERQAISISVDNYSWSEVAQKLVCVFKSMIKEVCEVN